MSNPEYDRLVQHVAEAGYLNSAVELLCWDKDVMMPKPSHGESVARLVRGKELGALVAAAHEKFTAPHIGALLRRLQQDKALSSEQFAMVREVAFDYERSTRIPADFVRKEAELFVRAGGIWEKARADGDFGAFAPVLSEVFEAAKERARLIDASRDSYEVLMETYEPGISIIEVRKHFARISDAIKPVIANLNTRQPVDDSFLDRPVPDETQLAFHSRIALLMGYDFSMGRLDLATHPFCGTLGRIATRLTDGLGNNLLSTMHEVGHALYDQQTIKANISLFGTPLAQCRSLGVHESQSRLWENHIGRSMPFWSFAFPGIREAYAPALDDVPIERFVAAINKAEPSLIRVNADELTYPMHVFLRFEIESDVLAGKLDVDDIPAAWNAKMREYLGVVPPNDSEGCLQDVHWSCGLIGYFPTYVLGTMMAAQQYEAAKKVIPDLESRIARGDMKLLVAWLGENIHAPARRHTTVELLRRATGEEFSSAAYISYLTRKFG